MRRGAVRLTPEDLGRAIGLFGNQRVVAMEVKVNPPALIVIVTGDGTPSVPFDSEAPVGRFVAGENELAAGTGSIRLLVTPPHIEWAVPVSEDAL